MYEMTVYAGAFVRRDFRRMLLRKGIRFEEEKGLIDSQFIISATPEQVDELKLLIGE